MREVIVSKIDCNGCLLYAIYFALYVLKTGVTVNSQRGEIEKSYDSATFASLCSMPERREVISFLSLLSVYWEIKKQAGYYLELDKYNLILATHTCFTEYVNTAFLKIDTYKKCNVFSQMFIGNMSTELQYLSISITVEVVFRSRC